jgi:hypothetical protein
MSDPLEPCYGPQAERSIRTTIDTTRLKRTQVALAQAYYNAFIAARIGRVSDESIAAIQRRYGNALDRRAKMTDRLSWASPLLSWSCGLGLAVAFALALTGGVYLNGYRLDLAFGLFFLAGLALKNPLLRLGAWEPKLRYSTPAIPHWILRFGAKRRAAQTLEPLRKLVPFDVQYDFAAGTVTCTRITPDEATRAWQRPLAGWKISGEGVILIFNTRTLEEPYLLMHEHVADLDEWLSQNGVQTLGSD